MGPDLAALVGSRICHDLISPIGAIGNGIELLTLVDGDGGSEIELISESVESASARIRFFRVAYGAAGPDQRISRSDVLKILSASARGGRLTYFWQIEGDQARQDVRLAFLIIQCFETAMPMGGDVHVVRDGDTWVLSAVSERLLVDKALWGSLTDPTATVKHTAAQVQFALLPRVLADAGKSLKVDADSDRITFRFWRQS